MMSKYIVYDIRTFQAVESDNPEDIRDIFDKLIEFGSIENYDLTVVEAESFGDALDVYREGE